MKTILSSLFAFTLLFGAASALPSDALAKAHDNGVGDAGEAPSGGRDSNSVGGGLGAGGVSGAVNGGDRGDDASEAGTSDDGRSNNAGGNGIGRD